MSDQPLTSEAKFEVTLLDLVVALVQRWKIVVGAPVAVGALTLGISFLFPNIYTGTARILPPQQSQSNAVAILGQLGAIGQLGSSALGLKNPSDVFVAMLKSRTVADGIIARFKLQELYD